MPRILIAEDDLVTRLQVRRTLDDMGVCDCAVDGAEVVEAYLHAYAAGEPYELLVLDIEMPKMGGLEALRTVREHEETNAVPIGNELKVVVLTKDESIRSVCDAFFHGHANRYITKPIARETLRGEVASLMGEGL